jgi:hypothetical protein
MRSMGGAFDFSGKQNIYHVAASMMDKYAEYPSCDSCDVIAGATWVSPSSSLRFLGPRTNPMSIWNAVPARKLSRLDVLLLLDFVILAMSQKGQWKWLLLVGSVGMPSTTWVVFRSVLGDGCPIR